MKDAKKNSIVTLTPAAIARIEDVLKTETGVLGIRLKFAGKTATEYKTQLALVRKEDETAPCKEDTVVPAGSFHVYIDAESLPFLKGVTLNFVQEGHQSGFRVENPNKPNIQDPMVYKLQKFFDEAINPSIASHGGFIELLEIRGDTLYVHMGGGCQGCAQSQLTLRQGVEKMVFEAFPNIRQIIDTTDHAAGKNPYYQKG